MRDIRAPCADALLGYSTQHQLDPTLTPLESMNIRKLQISSLARHVIQSFILKPPDPIAVVAVEEATKPLIKSIVSLVRQNTKGVSELTGECQASHIQHPFDFHHSFSLEMLSLSPIAHCDV